jgi:hypothetical protein
MKQRTQIILTLFFTLYLATVLFTDISLTGFWTDVLFSILLSILALKLVFKRKTDKHWLTISLKTLNIVCSVIVFGLLGLNLINPFAWDTFKLRSFYYESVDGRLFNAYFKPVGAYSGGEGNFWITESSKYFPLIEFEKYYEHAILWDFRDTEWEGEPVDQNKIVRSYIKDEIIDKQK